MDGKIYFQWHITDACNFHCRHCYQENFDEKLGLSFKDLVGIYDNIRAFADGRKIIITLTGGEPFLKKEFFELASFLDAEDAVEEISVITNGSLIDERITNELNRTKKLRHIKISLEGAAEQANDAIRGDGAFELAMKGIGLLKQNSKLKIDIMITLMKSNVDEVVNMLELCRDLRLDGLIIERFIPLGQSHSLKSEVLDAGGWRKVVNDVLAFAEISVPEDNMLPYKAFWVKFEDGVINLFGALCNLGAENFAIMPNGDLLPCRRFNFKMGNLLEKKLSDIVRDYALLRQLSGRNNLKHKCGTCFVEKCYGCRALAYAMEGDYFAGDSQCRR